MDVQKTIQIRTPDVFRNFNFNASDGTVKQDETSNQTYTSAIHREVVQSRVIQISSHTVIHEASAKGGKDQQKELKLF